MELTLKSGVKLLLKEVPPYAIWAAIEKLEEPILPIVMMEAKGREEENPFDPEYLEAVKEFEAKRANVIHELMWVFGSKLLEVPEGMAGPEDDEWTEQLEYLGINLGTTKGERYVQWLKYCAITHADDIEAFNVAQARLGGATEEDVAKVADSFRGDEERDTDMGDGGKKPRKQRSRVRVPASGNGA